MSEDQTRLITKLKVKEQWICDVCGKVIESDRDGMLEWDKYFIENDEIAQDNFRIVHGRWIVGCKDNRSKNKLADGHLHWFTGSDGLNKILSMLQRPNLDQAGLIEIIKRLHVDYYEEARTLFGIAIEDEYFDYDDGEHIPQDDLIRLIRKYSEKE